ncbi:TadE/TadG family type IV pilus assembly protein [Sphingomonas sp. BK580]|uniref:TadE/TadG family type IV pilus assembly protein n=1 Tax=Sphingomonas sp. BK580 TaxID=2586972 RepID=UPI0016222395|nr:TadE/TadG family type IV pilus assembly protein [Sphingomonas sp. BK580]MBB3692901.1 Flp pilus assembly protein TadG [Sphingomonas sp. BK580]
MIRAISLLRDRRGATVIEFALILPAVLSAVCGTIELGHMLVARMVLDGAVIEAARIATASVDNSQAARDAVMRQSITAAMSGFPLATGQQMSIDTRVFADFSTAYPEVYADANGNGRYDLGETFTDRNRNGKWDPATPITGTMGGAGDVLSITVRYPKKVLFGFLGTQWAMGSLVNLSATTVVRNEAVSRTS